MIPIEYLWLTVILVFAIIGMGRGLWKELGATTVLLLSLFALHLGEELILNKLTGSLPASTTSAFPEGTVRAAYYSVSIVFIAFIAYQGVTLEFPVKKQKGVFKWVFGYLGGLVNGYLTVGTVWNVLSDAKYLGISVPMGSNGTKIAVSGNLTKLHDSIVQALPVALMNSNSFVPYLILALGMILLLAIILK